MSALTEVVTPKAEAGKSPAVARRKPVGGDVADAIVASLDIPAIAALLANPDAKLREATMESIIAQAEKLEELRQPLTLRSDLSKRAIWRIASFVGANLIEQLMLRYGLDEEIKHHLNKELRARLQEGDVTENGGHDDAKHAIAAAQAAGRLDEAYMEAAAKAGQREIVILGLAALANLDEAVARKIIQSGSAKPLIALVWHAGLTMRVAFKIQSFVMKLPAGELIPARAGVHFPMNEDEMRWHLGYFGVVL